MECTTSTVGTLSRLVVTLYWLHGENVFASVILSDALVSFRCCKVILGFRYRYERIIFVMVGVCVSKEHIHPLDGKATTCLLHCFVLAETFSKHVYCSIQDARNKDQKGRSSRNSCATSCHDESFELHGALWRAWLEFVEFLVFIKINIDYSIKLS